MQPHPHIRFLVNPEEASVPEDWQVVESLVVHHRYYHAVEDIFRQFPERLPAGIKSRLKSNFSHQLQRQLLIATELQEICRVFNRERIDYLSLKGTSLALQLYGKISARFTRDIDFLVSPGEVNLALGLIKSMGYTIIKKERNRDTGNFRKIKKNQTLFHPQKHLTIEVHWNLFSNRHYFFGQDIFFRETVKVDLNGTAIPILNLHNTFIYLCLHGAYHEYFRLFWLRDIAVILQRQDLDWQKIILQAQREDIFRIVAFSAILAGKVFEFSTLFDKYEDMPQIRWLVDHCLTVINRSSLPRPIDRFRRVIYFIRLKRSWKYKLECVTGIGKRFWIR